MEELSKRCALSLFVSLVALIVLSPAVANCVSISDVEDDINDFVLATMEAKSTPGLSLSIVKDEEMFGRGYGVRRLNTTEYVTADTLFYIASTTKAFTATLLSQILLQQNLSLETPVKQFLSNFSLAEYYRQEQTSLVDLLAHRVGIPESLYNWILGEVKTREDIVRRGLYFKPTEPFRNLETYSNLFYIAAGLVVQELSGGRVWEDVMAERIFTPLGMRDTSFMDYLNDDQLLNDLATPYDVDRMNNDTMREISLEFFKHCGLGGPSGSIVSTAHDLTKWLYLLTHGGLSEAGERIIDDTVIANSMSPHIVSYSSSDLTGQPLDSGFTENYGLGWYTGFYNGYRMVNHAGYMFGYQSRATVYPAMKLGIFTCINGQNSQDGDGQIEIHNFITDLLMPNNNATTAADAAEWLIASKKTQRFGRSDAASQSECRSLGGGAAADEFCRRRVEEEISSSSSNGIDERRRRHRRSQKALDEYEGTFGNFAFGNATVQLDNTTGRLRIDYGDLARADMRQLLGGESDIFLADAYDPLWFFPSFQVIFARRADDNAVVNLTVPILLNTDPPVFVRDRKMHEAPAPPTCDC